MSNINGELVSLIKDIREYFVNQDAEQEKAKIAKPPKIQETQKDISGGSLSGFKPASGIAKSMIKVPKEGSTLAEIRGSAVEGDEGSLLKEEEIPEIPVEDEDLIEDKEAGEVPIEDAEEDIIPEEESSENMDEVKSLLKDIKTLLTKNNTLSKELANIKKSVDTKVETEIAKRMRKMGYVKSNPAIRKLGISQLDEIKKSTDKVIDNPDSVIEFVDKQAGKSWRQLAQERLDCGDLKTINTWR